MILIESKLSEQLMQMFDQLYYSFIFDDGTELGHRMTNMFYDLIEDLVKRATNSASIGQFVLVYKTSALITFSTRDQLQKHLDSVGYEEVLFFSEITQADNQILQNFY